MAEDYVAFGEIEPAFARTKELLLPFRRSIWLRIAVIAFFIGGGGINLPSPSWSTGDMPAGLEHAVTPFLPLIIAGVVALILLALLWSIIGTILQFVFVDMLVTNEWRILSHFSPRAGKGVRLFLFEVGLALLLLLIVAIPAAVVFIAVIVMTGGVNISAVVAILAALLILLVLLIPGAIIQMLTIDFVVPVMIRDDCGVIGGWRSVYPVLRAEWKQALMFVLAKIVLVIATSILQLIAMVIALIIIGIPGGLVVFAGHLALGSLLIDAVLATPFVLAAIVAMLLVAVPVITFHRYYGLHVLGRLAPQYALLP
ncbi:MAG: hypothetical protein APR53_07400 [Methanoculleus sp. SDB]|nr:MAG: hypothetical protein APR53_07400 [Methanoculleus sp. SDB]